jgi:hypothetical protein
VTCEIYEKIISINNVTTKTNKNMKMFSEILSFISTAPEDEDDEFDDENDVTEDLCDFEKSREFLESVVDYKSLEKLSRSIKKMMNDLESNCSIGSSSINKRSRNESLEENIIIAPIQINNENNVMGVNMISWNKIQIPAFELDAHISLIYTPSPKYYTIDDITDELPMPIQLVEPLLAYIGYRAFASISPNPQNDVGNVYYARFENSCETVKQFGILTAEDMDMGSKFNLRGFV